MNAMTTSKSIDYCSPFYGKRRPADQKGSRLRYVSDLLALGRTTIEESRSLLHWAREDMGFGKLGICGLSMGGLTVEARRAVAKTLKRRKTTYDRVLPDLVLTPSLSSQFSRIPGVVSYLSMPHDRFE